MEPVSIAEGVIASIKIISATIEKLKASKRIKEEEKGYLDNIKSESENLKRQILSLSDKSFKLLGGRAQYIGYQKGSIHRLLLFVKLGSLHRTPFKFSRYLV